MSRLEPRWRGRSLLVASAALTLMAGPAAAGAMAAPGALYTQTNDPAGNVVQKFDRAADGDLTPAASFPTAAGRPPPAGPGPPPSAAARARSISAATSPPSTPSTPPRTPSPHSGSRRTAWR